MSCKWILSSVVLFMIFKILLLKNLLYHIFLKFLIPGYTAYIEADQLKGAISKNDVIILDTRSREEYMVSHIPHAIWVGYEEFSLDKVTHLAKDTCIVVYCSVGYRSNQISKKLQEEGYSCVRNLYGGIFEWVNQGHTVYADGKKTDNIHPYSFKWGIWLSGGTKIYHDAEEAH